MIEGRRMVLAVAALVAGCCAAGTRPPLAGPTSVRANGSARAESRDGTPRGPATRSSAWRPANPPRPLEPWAFRIARYNGDGTIGLYLCVDETFHVYEQLASQPRPTELRVLFGRDYVLRDSASARVFFELRAADGALVHPTGPGDLEQDLHCTLAGAAELRCHHDDGGQDVVYTVPRDRIVGRVEGAEGGIVEMNAVEPAPQNDDQRRRVLFLWASYFVPADTSSHDGDAGFFSGPPY